MSNLTIHSPRGDITLDLNSSIDNAYLTAISVPTSVDDRTVRQLVNEFDPNDVAGSHLFTRLASAKKLDNPIDIGIIAGKIDPLNYSGLVTAEELKKRAVFTQAHLDSISARFGVDSFINRAPDDIVEGKKSELIAPLARLGFLSNESIDRLVSKTNIHIFDDVEILMALRTEELLTEGHIEQTAERFAIADYDLSDKNDVAILDGLYTVGILDKSHLTAVRASNPIAQADSFTFGGGTGI